MDDPKEYGTVSEWCWDDVLFQIIIRIETEIEKKRLAIRPDRQLNKDVGLKKKIVLLLLSYNPLW